MSVRDTEPLCFCKGSPWSHQWRNRKTGESKPYCEAARANLRVYMANYMNRPGKKTRHNAQKRARRMGTAYQLPEYDPL